MSSAHRALVVAAHPDDEVLAAAAPSHVIPMLVTMYRFIAAEGATSRYSIVTDNTFRTSILPTTLRIDLEFSVSMV